MSHATQKIDSLTGIRALAAIAVVLTHMLSQTKFGCLTPLIEKGYLGVDLFFILSGFILSHVYQTVFRSIKMRSLFEFLMLRLARIMPVHLVVLLLYCLDYSFLLLARGPKAEDSAIFSPMGLLYNILNLQAWGLAKHLSWNCPAWSISAEWFAYLLFPVLCLFSNRMHKAWINIAGIIGLFAGLYLFAIAHGELSIRWHDTYPLVRVGFEFTVGILLFNLFKLQLKKNNSAIPSFRWDLLTVVSVCLFIYGGYANFSDFILVPILTLLLYSLAFAGPLSKLVMGNKVMAHLGEISFSMYMIDAFATITYFQASKFLPVLQSLPASPILYVAVRLVMSLCNAHLLYLFIEKPARNKLRDYIKMIGKNNKVPELSSKGLKDLLPET